MSILLRVEEIRANEHRKLRSALSRSWAALKELEEARLEAARTVPQVDIWGQPLRTDEIPGTAPGVNLRPLFDAWEPFEGAVLKRLDRWEQDLWPAVQAWDSGRPVGERVKKIARKLEAERRGLDRHLQRVRQNQRGISVLQAPFVSLYSAIDLCDRAEGAVTPALQTGDRVLADHAERGRTPADVVRALRGKITSQESEPDLEPQQLTERSAFGRFFQWLSGDRP